MFIGHFAVGLSAKQLRPHISLGSYFLAVQFLDLLWPSLLLLEMEKVSIEPGITAMTPLNFLYYPYSHSLLMAVLWSAAAYLVTWLATHERKSSMLIAACVVSHWVLDLITHRPDLPLTFSQEIKVGLGLWNNKAATVVVEMLMFAIGIFLYTRATHAKNLIGKYAFWGLIAFLLFIQIGNIIGPPPPNVNAIAWAGHGQWLFVIWAYWVDRNRTPVMR
jgi:hypothetical protein